MKSVNLEEISILHWLKFHRLKNEKGDPINFDDHFFLLDIYADMSPNLCVMKAAQVGLSTCEILKMMFLASKQKMDIIYTLPTDKDVRTFVGGKVNRLLTVNPILTEYCSDKDTIEQKQVGSSMIYFRGTWTQKAAIMVTADVLIHDEKDSSKRDVVDAYQARLQHSKFRWLHTFSHPSVPMNGVHAEWEQSDQKHWFVKCEECKKEQFMEFPDSIDFDKRIYVCKHCKAKLDDRRTGRWISKYKNRKFSGYWVNLMMCPLVDAGQIIDKFRSSTPDFFWNKVLGLPYEGEGNTVSRTSIQRNIVDVENERESVVIGCDSGLIKHWVAGNKNGIFDYGATEKWSDVEALLRRYPKSICVIDALPDLTAPREMREKFPARVFLGNFNRDRKGMQIARWGKGKEDGSVMIDRNRAIQFVVDEIAKGLLTFNGKPEFWEKYIQHFENIFRTKETDSIGNPVLVWQKKTTEDHWVMATCLWRVGMSRFGEQGAKFAGLNTLDGLPSAPTIMPDEDPKLPNPRQKFIFEIKPEDWRS
jgi:hypothetical protein